MPNFQAKVIGPEYALLELQLPIGLGHGFQILVHEQVLVITGTVPTKLERCDIVLRCLVKVIGVVINVSERALHLAGGYPVVRQQLDQSAGLLRRQSCEHILEIGIRIMPIHARRLDQAHDCRRPFAAA